MTHTAAGEERSLIVPLVSQSPELIRSIRAAQHVKPACGFQSVLNLKTKTLVTQAEDS